MENDINISLGKIFQLTRKSKGYTQEYVAEKLQLGSRYISDLERGKTIGSIQTFIKLCNLYEVTPTFILQNYLKINEDLQIDPNLIGFYSLSCKDKEIILQLIKFMNSKEE
ncbi:MAG: helix-turn-helix transcriptional regulator [Clostridia bacterium]|nr:helix-turn-helix transcriptional regulator [Clostridia bacterium]